MAPDAPVLHDKGGEARGNIYVEIHGEVGSVAAGFAEADAVHERTYSTLARPARAPGDARLDRLARRRRPHPRPHQLAGAVHRQAEALPTCSACTRATVHVFTERVGGGFGGKQEMLSEDLCVLAALKTGRPVKWEFTREEQFIGATTRHPMTTRVKLGAKRDGTLTAIQIHVVSNTGAYGGHAGETLAAALGSPITAYRCAEQEGGRLRGLHQHGAGRRLPRLRRVADRRSPSSARSTSWRSSLGMDPFAMRRKNMIRPDRLDRVGLAGPVRRRVRQLRARPVPRPRRGGARERPRRRQARRATNGSEGTGIALAMLDCGPPTEHRSGAQMALLPDGTLPPRRRLDRDGQRLGHRRTGRSPPRFSAARAGRHRHRQRRHRPDALRHRHVRQHRHRRRRAGGRR